MGDHILLPTGAHRLTISRIFSVVVVATDDVTAVAESLGFGGFIWSRQVECCWESSRMSSLWKLFIVAFIFYFCHLLINNHSLTSHTLTISLVSQGRHTARHCPRIDSREFSTPRPSDRTRSTLLWLDLLHPVSGLSFLFGEDASSSVYKNVDFPLLFAALAH